MTTYTTPVLRELGTVDPRRCYHAVLTALDSVQDRFRTMGTFDPEGLHEDLTDLAEMSRLVVILSTCKGE